jgi:hypothetical protein
MNSATGAQTVASGGCGRIILRSGRTTRLPIVGARLAQPRPFRVDWRGVSSDVDGAAVPRANVSEPPP